MLLVNFRQLATTRAKEIAASEALRQAQDALNRAQNAADEAEHVKQNLVRLAEVMASATLSLAQNTGRWAGSVLYDMREKVRESILQVLGKMGLDADQRDRLLDESGWYRLTERDYVSAAMGDSIPDGLVPEQSKQWEKMLARPLDQLAEPNEITAFFGDSGLLTSERQERIEDYRYYKQFRKHRRPQVFRRMGE